MTTQKILSESSTQQDRDNYHLIEIGRLRRKINNLERGDLDKTSIQYINLREELHSKMAEFQNLIRSCNHETQCSNSKDSQDRQLGASVKCS